MHFSWACVSCVPCTCTESGCLCVCVCVCGEEREALDAFVFVCEEGQRALNVLTCVLHMQHVSLCARVNGEARQV